MLKIWEAEVLPQSADAKKGEPADVLEADHDTLTIQTGDGVLKICSLQLEGKKRMDVASFLRGYPVEVGSRVGKE